MHDIGHTSLEAGANDEMDEFEGDSLEFESDQEYAEEFEGALDELDEMELAEELTTVGSEGELDQFLGKLVRRAWRGVKRRLPPGLASSLLGTLRNAAKAAVPRLAGLAGAAIGGPLGATVANTVSSKLAQALEMEMVEGEFEGGEGEMEMARQFVRVAGSAARSALNQAARGTAPSAAVQAALLGAARRHVPAMRRLDSVGAESRGRSGRWIRRGRRIILLGL